MRTCSRLVLVLAWLLAGLAVGLAAGPARAADASFVPAADRARQCGVAGEVVDTLAERVARGDLDPARAGALLAPLLEACTEQLPLAPVEDKLAEGLAKRVDPARIVPVLEQRVAAYRRARALLLPVRGEGSPDALLVLGEGLASGVPEADVATYLSAFGKLPEATFRTGLAMVAYQGQAGFDPALTRGIIAAGVENRDLDAGWRYFVRIILAARRRGLDDATVADAAVAVLRAGGPVTDVVTRLGFTGRSLSGLPDDR